MIVMSSKKGILINASIFGAIIFGYIGFTFLMGQSEARTLSFENIGLEAPLAPIAGGIAIKPTTLKSLRGKNFLIHFWSTGCEGCQADHQRFEALARGQSAQAAGAIKILEIASGDGPESIQKSGQTPSSLFAQYYEPSGHLALALGVKALPQTLLVDSGGHVVAQIPNAMSDDQLARLRSQCTELAANDKTLGAIPEFELENSQGSKVSRSTLENKVWVADFFFTDCQGICPLLTEKMRDLQETFKGHPDFNLVSITIHPNRDRPEVLKVYQKSHGAMDQRWMFLTGQPEAVTDLLVDGFKLGTHEAPEFHTGKIVLVDRLNRIHGYYESTSPHELSQLRADISDLLKP